MTNHQHLLVNTIVNGPFVENCYIVADETSKSAIVIDPGDEEDRIAHEIASMGVTVTKILATHGHVDHAGSVVPLQRTLKVPFAMHPADNEWLATFEKGAMLGLPARPPPTIDEDLADGDEILVGTIKGQVLATPGHSAGGVCFYFPEQQVVFVGDTLFNGSIGRTDLPGGSLPTLLSAIRQRLLTLSDNVIVYSGHGPQTTIGGERKANPFLGSGAARYL